ncbi:Mannose-binding lectin [Pseudocohnilembus persalinus]|uniref:Mannose-binding lectin n=1 Tax=Pseudocohnilembus persalinus TaxID=266149 RepID=A0A0V0QRY3_PSEPJ|nr:Mannose-binding lectin [Pseudocohnilembus persalinus]|eukprot:KRX04980.1 Mannose-binding lectin [Pseudocohnilembus persalinus]
MSKQRNFNNENKQDQHISSDCQQQQEQLQIATVKATQLRKTNDLLRKQLREISQQLDKELEKVQQNKLENKQQKVNQQEEQEMKIYKLKLELVTLTKQVKTYKKTHKKLKERVDAKYDVEKVSALQRVTELRQRELNDLQIEQRNLIALKRDAERNLKKIKPDRILNSLRDDILHTKNLIKEQKRIEKINEKNFKKQEEFVVKLELKHKSVCEQVGADFDVKKPTEQELFSEEAIKKSKQNLIKNQDVYKKKSNNLNTSKQSSLTQVQPKYIKLDISDKGFKKQEQRLNDLQKQIDRIKSTNIQNSQKVETQLESLKLDNEQTKNEIELKEKDIQTAYQRLKELQNLVSQNGSIVDSYFYNSSKVLGSNKNQFNQVPQKLEVRTESGGVKIGSTEARSFHDCQNLPENKIYKLKQITIVSAEEYILSIESKYKLADGTTKNIISFKNSVQAKDQKEQILKLQGIEQISNITGYFDEKCIKYLKIITTRGKFLMAGDEKQISNLYQFSFTPAKNEQIISLFGTVDKLPRIKKNIGRESEYCLISLGCEFSKKDRLFQLLQNQKNSQDDQEEKNSDYDEISEDGDQQQQDDKQDTKKSKLYIQNDNQEQAHNNNSQIQID